MLLCPKCKTEYEERCTVCSDCGSKLIEQPEVHEELIKENKDFKIIQFIAGILLILCSHMLSYKLTLMYFATNGSGKYRMEDFLWMLKAYHYSFLVVGIIICLPCIIYWYKGNKKEH